MFIKTLETGAVVCLVSRVFKIKVCKKTETGAAMYLFSVFFMYPEV